MKFFTAAVLLLLSILLELLTGTLFGAMLALPLGVLFFFSTMEALPLTLAGAILAGFSLDVLCCRADPLLLVAYPLALLAGNLMRWKLGREGRWTALPAGAVIHLVLNGILLYLNGAGTSPWGWQLLFNTAAGSVETLLCVFVLDVLARAVKIDRYAAQPWRELNAAPRKHRAPARFNRITPP